MEAVLAWQTSCRQIFNKAAMFQSRGNEWRLSQFRYRTQVKFNPSVFNIDAVLPLLRAWQGTSDNDMGPEQAKNIICRTGDAKVHAESALMLCIAAGKVGIFFRPVSLPDTNFPCRMSIAIRIGLLGRAGSVARCVGYYTKFTTEVALPNLYFQERMGPSLPGSLPLACRMLLCWNFEKRCLLHVKISLLPLSDQRLRNLSSLVLYVSGGGQKHFKEVD